MEEKKRVIIVGGGFGGVATAKALNGVPVEIGVVDRRNYHLFQPLLYQVATAALNPSDIAAPIRRIFRRQDNVSVVLGEVEDVNLEDGEISIHGERIAYDYLVLAAGCTHSYFGKDEWERLAPGLKTIDDATEIRRRFLLAFEAAEVETDPEAIRACLTFIVVGAGPTGVELAGAMAEIAHEIIPPDFRHVDTTTARIILMEGA
ncbi:MAG: FAD-dependent oxidoreductase, partial [Cyanobacteria bacterium P01_F01_bin.42]